MSFAIKYGLFRLNITDYHAILGVPLDADPKQIRLQYLQIAQKLHPDICQGDQSEKDLANRILSRLVNPAYEQLSRKSCFAEHQLVLTQIGKRLAEKSDRMTVASQPAKDLLQSGDKLEIVYNRHLKKVTTNQYDNLEKITDKIAVISELNLIYLMLKQGQELNREETIIKSKPPQQKPQASSSKPATPSAPPTVETPQEESSPQARVASFIRRAKEYLAKESYPQAIAELKDALKFDPNNSTCHGLMGKIYLRQNQLTMAKVHIKKAHNANPQDPIVIEAKKELDHITKKQNPEQKSQASKSSIKSPDTKGLFGGLFGAKRN